MSITQLKDDHLIQRSKTEPSLKEIEEDDFARLIDETTFLSASLRTPIYLHEPLMFPASPSSFRVILSHLPLSFDPVSVYHQTFQPHRPSRMDLICTDTDLGAKSEPHTIRHSCTGVPEYASAVDPIKETIGNNFRRSQNRVGVLRRM